MVERPFAPARGWILVEPNPIVVASRGELGEAIVSWSTATATATEVRVGSPSGPLFARASAAGREATGPWVSDGLELFLQDASSGQPERPDNTIASVVVRVRPSDQSAIETSSLVTPNPPVGLVDFGDLRRAAPIGEEWGFTRGRPIDRYYIERFLERNAALIRGRVVEFGNDAYTRRFGANRVSRRDVMNVQEDVPGTTIRADLTNCDEIADATFDCIICTQVLQLIYEVPSAIRTLHRILKPGGAILATCSGISCSFVPGWGYFNWSFTPTSVERLFGSVFLPEQVNVEGFGNLLGSIAFLAGLAIEDVDERELDERTAGYEIVICVKARKPEQAS